MAMFQIFFKNWKICQCFEFFVKYWNFYILAFAQSDLFKSRAISWKIISFQKILWNLIINTFSRWNYFCEISPIIRVDRDAEDTEPIPHQEPYWGIVPDSCCGTRPYNSCKYYRMLKKCCSRSDLTNESSDFFI